MQGHSDQVTNLLVGTQFTDLDAKSQVRTDLDTVLTEHEKNNKDNYLDLCIN